jgi:hypothetical protein
MTEEAGRKMEAEKCIGLQGKQRFNHGLTRI